MRTREFELPVYDLSAGLISAISDVRVAQERYLKACDNIMFVPDRGWSSRPGSRDSCSATLASPPHSLGKYLPTTGSRRLFVGASTGIYEDTGSAYTAQTLPAIFASKPLTFEQYNDALFVAEHLGANRPYMYIGEAATWRRANLEAPAGATITLGVGAGAVDDGVHHYRLRNRYRNGGSTAQYLGSITAAAPNSRGVLALAPTAGPGGRTDWLGWTLERTKANDPLGASGRYFEVAQGTSAGYNDDATDVTLWDLRIEGWYTAPVVANGLIYHAGSMWVWAGSTLYPSWVVGDAASLGICNYDPLNAIVVGNDDGDIILAAVRQKSRLLVFKSRSYHSIEGQTLGQFYPTELADNVGVVGPRALAAFGDRIFWMGDEGLYTLRGDRPVPFGWDQVGAYTDAIERGNIDKVVVRVVRNRYLLVWYPTNGSATPNEGLIHDFVNGTWTHHTGMSASDILAQADSDFSGARVFFADPDDDGSGGYHVWVGLDGDSDKRDSTGANGTAIPVRTESPWYDKGSPTLIKDIDRFELLGRSEEATVNVTIETDEGIFWSTTFRFTSPNSVWAPKVGGPADSLVWDDPGVYGNWAGDDEDQSPYSGVACGTLGKRFRVILTASTDRLLEVAGYTVFGRFMEERKV